MNRQRVVRTCRRRYKKVRNRFDRRPVVHFLHVGKTAGTALRSALKDVRGTADYRLIIHGHTARLDRVPAGHKFIFCVRDPVDRYVSAFMSRQRQGEPRYSMPWSEQEAIAFSRFESPEHLALSLSDQDRSQRDAAEHAMRTIRHLSRSYWYWFSDASYFRRRSDDLLWVGRQESLDVAGLADALGVERLTLPNDPTVANRRVGARPELSEVAVHNLRLWYAKDYEFLDLCDQIYPFERNR
jgi:hypothetical protein